MLLAGTTRGGLQWKEDIMAEYGEWNRKGATLGDVTAKAEYGVERDVIVKGIQTGNWSTAQGRYGAIRICGSCEVSLSNTSLRNLARTTSVASNTTPSYAGSKRR